MFIPANTALSGKGEKKDVFFPCAPAVVLFHRNRLFGLVLRFGIVSRSPLSFQNQSAMDVHIAEILPVSVGVPKGI